MTDTKEVIWETGGGRTLHLLTLAQLEQIPDGSELFSILDERVIKGVDKIDLDTRGGYLAYGRESSLV